MKRFLFSVLLAGVAFSHPAAAQDKKVVTVNPDGSVTVTNPQGGGVQQLPAPSIEQQMRVRRQPPYIEALPIEEQMRLRRAAPQRAPAQAPKPPPDAARAPEEKPAPVEKKQTEAPVKPAAPKKAPAVEKPQTAKPAVKETKKPSAPPPAKKAVPKPPKKKPPMPETVEAPRVREPAAPESMGRADPRAIPETRAPGPVTPDEAKRIALDVGPPARAVDVFPADYNGRKVFQVVFHTQEGERYVLIDRATGEIVRD